MPIIGAVSGGTVESSPLLGRTTSSHVTFKQVAARSTAYIPTLIFVLILVYVTAYQPYCNGPAIRSDGQGYHIWTFALKKWDFRFCEYAALGYAVPVDAGRCVVKWPPGVALFRFPVMTWFVDVNNHESFSQAEHWVSLIFGAGLTLAISIIGLRILKRIGLDPLESQAVLFILVFGTGLFHYGDLRQFVQSCLFRFRLDRARVAALSDARTWPGKSRSMGPGARWRRRIFHDSVPEYERLDCAVLHGPRGVAPFELVDEGARVDWRWYWNCPRRRDSTFL